MWDEHVCVEWLPAHWAVCTDDQCDVINAVLDADRWGVVLISGCFLWRMSYSSVCCRPCSRLADRQRPCLASLWSGWRAARLPVMLLFGVWKDGAAGSSLHCEGGGSSCSVSALMTSMFPVSSERLQLLLTSGPWTGTSSQLRASWAASLILRWTDVCRMFGVKHIKHVSSSARLIPCFVATQLSVSPASSVCAKLG